jgi:hypothetical protein
MAGTIRTILGLCAAAVVTVSTTGCVSNLFPGGPSVAGVIYTGVTDPAQYLAVAVDPGAKGQKRGTASSQAFLGLFAAGNSGVDAAMNAGGITRVHHVDHQVQLVLGGLWAKATTIVYGE